MSDSLQPYGLQHSRFLCPTLSLRAGSNLCPLSWWCYLTISSKLPSSPFAFSLSQPQVSPVSQLFTSGGQTIQVSASVLPMNIQGWFPLALIDLISLLSEGFSRVFSSTTVWKYQFFGAQPSLWSKSHIHTRLLEKPQLWLYGVLLAKWCLCFLICCLGLS